MKLNLKLIPRCILAGVVILCIAGTMWAGINWGYQAPVTPPTGALPMGRVVALHLGGSLLLGGGYYWLGRRLDPRWRGWALCMPAVVSALAPWVTAWIAHRYGRMVMSSATQPISAMSMAMLFLLNSYSRDRAVAKTAENETGDAPLPISPPAN